MSQGAPKDRRAADPRLDQVVMDVQALQQDMRDNTAMTKQIKEILEGFRIAGRCAKWIAKWVAIISGIVVAFHQGWLSVAALLGWTRGGK